ncbi:MAG: hypothetical protein HQ591_05820 [candidate division Zixibacteria bacterium]|nr:hypothetical protein [Candidatus Tariuqbacter arcticus]
MSKKISELTVAEFTELMTEIIDRRIEALLDPDGELREAFIVELLNRKNNPDIVDMNEVWAE